MNPIIKFLFITLGTLSVAFGVVGIFVPILPTTPFLLLAAFFYARSSDKFLHWLLYNRWFGTYIRNYREGRGMPRREKILTITALWLTIGLSAAFAVSVWWVKLLLVVIAIAVTIHLMRIKTYRPEPDPKTIKPTALPEQSKTGDS